MSDSGRSLADRSAAFAAEVQVALDGVLPGERTIISRQGVSDDRFIVQPEGDKAADRRIPVYVDGEHLGNLSVSIYLDLDRVGRHLKTVKSDIALHSVLDRTALVRLEYLAEMNSAPIAHWHIHAERGAFSHLLARAHAHRPDSVSKPHDLSSLHFPVGGERFRPCLEDMLQFLVVECGVDSVEGWESVVAQGREAWRRRQLGAAVRDDPDVAAHVLRELGLHVAGESGTTYTNPSALRQW